MPILGSSASQSGRTPGQPTSVSATAGDAQAVVSFTVPAYTGKGTVNYTATSSPGGFTASGASSPLTVTGLSNGTAYTFTVRATTAGVQGSASSASASVTPALPAYALSQTFNASGTYTVPSGKTQVAVIAIGAGGGGGGSPSGNHANVRDPENKIEGSFSGGGGGGGSVAYFTDYAVNSAQTFSVTVGSGGSAGNGGAGLGNANVPDGSSNPGNSGNAGGQTSFSNLVTLNAGNGGVGGTRNGGGQAGSGGTVASNNVTLTVTQNGPSAGYGSFSYQNTSNEYPATPGASNTATINITGIGAANQQVGGGGGGGQPGYTANGGNGGAGGAGGAGGGGAGGNNGGPGSTGNAGSAANARGGGGGGGGGSGGRPNPGTAGGTGANGQVLVYVR